MVSCMADFHADFHDDNDSLDFGAICTTRDWHSLDRQTSDLLTVASSSCLCTPAFDCWTSLERFVWWLLLNFHWNYWLLFESATCDWRSWDRRDCHRKSCCCCRAEELPAVVPKSGYRLSFDVELVDTCHSCGAHVYYSKRKFCYVAHLWVNALTVAELSNIFANALICMLPCHQ